MIRYTGTALVLASLLLAVPASSFSADVIFQMFARERHAQEGDRDFCLDRNPDGKLVTMDSYSDELSCESSGYVWADEARQGRLGLGDLFLVYDGTFDSFGKKECMNYPPAKGGGYFCLYVTGIDLEEASRLIKPLKITDKHIEVEETRYYLDISTLPTSMANELMIHGKASSSWEGIRGYIVDKKTGETR